MNHPHDGGRYYLVDGVHVPEDEYLARVTEPTGRHRRKSTGDLSPAKDHIPTDPATDEATES